MTSLWGIAAIIVGLFQFYLTYVGFNWAWGMWAAIIAVVVSLAFRTSILLVIGSYMGAVHVLGWPWWGGVLIALPALVFMIPGKFVSFLKTNQIR